MTISWVLPEVGHYHDARLRALAQRADSEVCVVELFRDSSFEEFRATRGEAKNYRLEALGLSRSTSRIEQNAAVRAALDRVNPSVVLVPGWSDRFALTALLWSLEKRVPAVLFSDSNERDFARRPWVERIKARVVQLFSAGVVAGQPQKEYVTSLGLAADRIWTGYDVVDNNHFASGADKARSTESLRQELGLPPHYFIASGRFVEKKNFLGLLEAYAAYAAAEGAQAWNLVILGDGSGRTKLTSFIKTKGLADLVHMPGFKPYDQLPSYYGLAEAFVHASKVEQWGLVVNEAMAAGLPVLVSERCGCADDLVASGVNGYAFDPNDSSGLVRLLSQVTHERDLRRMGLASRVRIQEWSPARFAESVLQAIEVSKHGKSEARWWERTLIAALSLR